MIVALYLLLIIIMSSLNALKMFSVSSGFLDLLGVNSSHRLYPDCHLPK